MQFPDRGGTIDEDIAPATIYNIYAWTPGDYFYKSG